MNATSASRRRRNRVVLAAATAVAALGTTTMGVQPAAAMSANEHKVTICHATSSATNPFTVNSVDVSSIVNLDGGNGHGRHTEDVIPPFTDVKGLSFAGQNWNAGSAEFVDGGCLGDNGGGFPGG